MDSATDMYDAEQGYTAGGMQNGPVRAGGMGTEEKQNKGCMRWHFKDHHRESVIGVIVESPIYHVDSIELQDLSSTLEFSNGSIHSYDTADEKDFREVENYLGAAERFYREAREESKERAFVARL